MSDILIGATALAVAPLMWGMSLAPLSFAGRAIASWFGDPIAALVSLIAHGAMLPISIYASVRVWALLAEGAELGWTRVTPIGRRAVAVVAAFSIVSISSWAVVLERRIALEQQPSIQPPANMPLQPTRAAAPNEQREAAGSGPRG